MSLKYTDVTFFVAGCILLIGFLIPNVWLKIIFLVVMGIWLRSIKEYLSICIIVLVMFIVWTQVLYQPNITNIEGKVVSIKDSYFIVNVHQVKIMVYGDFDVHFDATVLVKGELEEVASTRNRVGYSFEKWAKSRNIQYTCNAQDVEIIKKGFSLRNQVYQKIQTQDEDIAQIMKMFLFHMYDDIGWLYIGLSLGIHLSFILKVLQNSFSYFFLEKEVTIISCLFCLFICLFYHFDLISCRLLLRNLLKIPSLSKKNRWGCLVILLLCLFPQMIYELGFLLPICIGFVYTFSTSRVYGVSQLVVMWLQLIMNGYVSIMQIMVSRILYPLFSCMYLVCFLNIWIPIHFPLRWFSKLLTWLHTISLYEGYILGKPYVFLSVVFCIILIQYVVTTNRKYLLLILLLFGINHFQNYWFGFSRVVYIDVGQGDCTLISLPFHQGNILVDTGGSVSKDVAKDIVFPVLSSYGIAHLDMVIVTHNDFDHMGALESLSTLIKIDKVVTDKSEFYSVGNFKMYDGLSKYTFEGDNENSLTGCFSLYDSTFLYLGDITKDQEEIFVDTYDALRIDYLKLAHHGSNTSTSKQLLESTRPLFAIISCGDNNYYGHPSIEVVERLNGYSIPYFTTKDEGMIEILVTPIFDVLMMQQRIIFKNKMRY